MTTQNDVDKPFACPECARRFTRQQGLSRHLKETHGRQSTRDVAAARRAGRGSAEVESPSVLALRAQLHDLGEPLREQLRQIEARLVVLDGEARELRGMRTQLGGVLAKLDAQPSKGMPKAATQAAAVANRARRERQLAAKVAGVEAYLLGHRDELRDGFTVNQLVPVGKNGGVPGGLSQKTAQEVVDVLRDRGFVRADRVVQGGGMSYKLIEGVDV